MDEQQEPEPDIRSASTHTGPAAISEREAEPEGHFWFDFMVTLVLAVILFFWLR